MKKLLAILFILVIASTAVLLTACKGTPSLNYSNIMANATQYNFKIVYENNDDLPIYIDCAMSDGAYAYRFSQQSYNFIDLSYRQIFVDGKFYEIVENKTLGWWIGEYKVTADVSATSEQNFIYKYTSMITTGGFATLLQKGKKGTLNGKECTQYAFSYDGADYTYVFENDTAYLLQFTMTDAEGTKKLTYSDYKFSDIDIACLTVPASGIAFSTGSVYVERDTLIYEYFID